MALYSLTSESIHVPPHKQKPWDEVKILSSVYRYIDIYIHTHIDNVCMYVYSSRVSANWVVRKLLGSCSVECSTRTQY